MNVRIFWVRAMKFMYAQTRPRFILSSKGVFGGMEFEPMLTPREKSPLPKMSPEEDRTRDTVDSEPKHYQLSYSGPLWEYKPRSSLCIHAFHRTNSKCPDIHVLHGWMPATRTHPTCTIHENVLLKKITKVELFLLSSDHVETISMSLNRPTDHDSIPN